MSCVLISVITLLHRNPAFKRSKDAAERIEVSMDKMHTSLNAR